MILILKVILHICKMGEPSQVPQPTLRSLCLVGELGNTQLLEICVGQMAWVPKGREWWSPGYLDPFLHQTENLFTCSGGTKGIKRSKRIVWDRTSWVSGLMDQKGAFARSEDMVCRPVSAIKKQPFLWKPMFHYHRTTFSHFTGQSFPLEQEFKHEELGSIVGDSPTPKFPFAYSWN